MKQSKTKNSKKKQNYLKEMEFYELHDKEFKIITLKELKISEHTDRKINEMWKMHEYGGNKMNVNS